MKKALLFALVLATGCEPYVEPESQPPIQKLERSNVLCFVVDCSGSFTSQLTGNDAPAFRFFVSSIDRYFKDRDMRPGDRVIISQLSGDASRCLLYEGSPTDIMRRFDADSLRKFLMDNAHPGGSHVYSTLDTTIQYTASVANGCDTCFLVLSDFEGNAPTEQQDREKLIQTLRRLPRESTAIGCYWISPYMLSQVTQLMNEAGVNAVLETSIVGDPALPTFN